MRPGVTGRRGVCCGPRAGLLWFEQDLVLELTWDFNPHVSSPGWAGSMWELEPTMWVCRCPGGRSLKGVPWEGGLHRRVSCKSRVGPSPCLLPGPAGSSLRTCSLPPQPCRAPWGAAWSGTCVSNTAGPINPSSSLSSHPRASAGPRSQLTHGIGALSAEPGTHLHTS